jgi:hypothetical protein
MKNLSETLEKYNHNIVRALSDFTSKSINEIQDLINVLDADGYINLVAAIDQDDQDLVNDILDQAREKLEPEQDQLDSVIDIKRRIRDAMRNRSRPQSQNDDIVLGEISKLKKSDWNLIWPDLDRDELCRLYLQVDAKPIKSWGATPAVKLWKWTQDNILETVLYQGQLVEMKISHGPANTVGIMWGDQLKMVPRDHIAHLQERVIGLSAMPSLSRVKTLAGIVSEPLGDRSAPAPATISQVHSENPMDLSLVQVPGQSGPVTLKTLRGLIREGSRLLAAELASEAADYARAQGISALLMESITVMNRALDDMASLRKRGGTAEVTQLRGTRCENP